MIRLKTKDDVKKLQEGGRILSTILDEVIDEAVAGVTPTKLDRLARERIKAAGCVPSFLNYAPKGHEPFPAALCVSVNDAIVHGLPSDAPLSSGDVVGVDLGLVYENTYYLDSARTTGVGALSDEAGRLIAVTKQALELGIEAAQPGNRTGDIGAAVQTYVESEGFDVVRQLVGHGVGFDVHEPPQVPNYGDAGQGEPLEPGLVIAIEPMVTIGDPTVETGPDGWSVQVKTGELTAHFEHTVAVTEDGPVVLTSSQNIK